MNKNKFFEYLKNKKLYILSPHFDDAILSMGMLLYLLRDNADITVINIFTNAHNGPYTLSAKKFIRDSGYHNAVKLFNDRLAEDKMAMQVINANHLNLGFMDALFRKKPYTSLAGKYVPELDHIYPTYHWHITKKIQSGDMSQELLKNKLMEIIPPEAVIFSPSGIGGHVDHIIVSQVVRSLFGKTLFYLDFPYYFRLNDLGTPPQGYKKYDLEINLAIKIGLINNYHSQISGLFPGGIIPMHQEHFYLPADL